jgi:hypothetical protein
MPRLRFPGSFPIDAPSRQEAQAPIGVSSTIEAGATVFEPTEQGLDLAEWARSTRRVIHEHLHRSGAVLFRNFNLSGAEDFERAVRAMATSGELMAYVENTSPRTTIRGNVKTSTDHPPEQPIVLHNEHSFSEVFPSKLFLHCQQRADAGGETPLADCRRILARVPPEIRAGFSRKGGYRYVRNFGDGFGPDWPSVFQTRDRGALESYLTAHGIEFEWKGGDRLRIQYRRPTEVRHPVTGELVWFNHVLFWHVLSLEPSVRDLLVRSFDERDLPNHCFYGDGSAIEPEVIEALRRSYADETTLVSWRPHDVLLIDNVLRAHGRQPYSGARLIHFAMADPWTHHDVAVAESV